MFPAVLLAACVHDWDKYEPEKNAVTSGTGGAGGAGGATSTGGGGGAGGANAFIATCVANAASDHDALCMQLCAVYDGCVAQDGDCAMTCSARVADCTGMNSEQMCECASGTNDACAQPFTAMTTWNSCMPLSCYGQ